MRKDIKEENLINWIKEGLSKSKMCELLNCKQDTLNSYLKKFKIEYKGKQSRLGSKNTSQYVSYEDYIKKVEAPSSYRIKKKLVYESIKEDKCECCGISEWQGKFISLELHHIDGNRFHNFLNNLMILCPNCHSQTPNHGSKKRNGPVA